MPTHIMTTASILLILDKGLITSSEMLVSKLMKNMVENSGHFKCSSLAVLKQSKSTLL